MPAAVSSQLGKATAALWAAARAEADQAFQADRGRLEATLNDERAIRAEALATAEGMLGRVEDLTERVQELRAELAEARLHLQAVRADLFWERVVQEIHGVLPENGSMRVVEIANLLGADLAQEATAYPKGWSIKALRKRIEQRILHRRLFARFGSRFVPRPGCAKRRHE